jgi:hypothetical protein
MPKRDGFANAGRRHGNAMLVNFSLAWHPYAHVIRPAVGNLVNIVENIGESLEDAINFRRFDD